MARRRISPRGAGWVAFAALALALPASCQAGHAALEAVAANLASGISAKGGGTVAVAYFAPANVSPRPPSQFRRELTEEFTADLARAAPRLFVLDGVRLDVELADHGLLSIDRYMMSPALARYLNADVLVTGTLAPREQGFELRLRATDLVRDKTIAEARATLPKAPGWAAGPAAPVLDPKTGIYLAARGPITTPQCVSCPRPSYSVEAIRNNVEGSVWVLATVGANGLIASATALNRLSSGPDDEVVKQIEKWKFNPARAPDGKAVPVRVEIRVDFHLLR